MLASVIGCVGFYESRVRLGRGKERKTNQLFCFRHGCSSFVPATESSLSRAQSVEDGFSTSTLHRLDLLKDVIRLLILGSRAGEEGGLGEEELGEEGVGREGGRGGGGEEGLGMSWEGEGEVEVRENGEAGSYTTGQHGVRTQRQRDSPFLVVTDFDTFS